MALSRKSRPARAGRQGPARRRVAALASGGPPVSAQPAERAPAGRSRRAREPAARQVVQKVKLTEGERDQLRARAGELGVTVPRLLVESALADVTVTGTERRAEMAELFETRRLLAT